MHMDLTPFIVPVTGWLAAFSP